ncbi:hypothetical protein J2S43_005070 [Catenuloplanes nepalensis]|uniref:Uncharacterized protein n=1 Tax=Catenuloplanes nepalensis TaxID=587533 RepID=A0ABT9MYR3_9ACTN|nr:SCO2524 family protein [Catenuloplanes nepalensis]MDP9796558.1 hypothetical protein [Catenuloplanes nepalensis]
MDVQPRQHLLEVWRAFASYSGSGSDWRWGGRDGSNSISDAEQLLCVMAPAADVPTFRIDRPDETEDDVIGSLAALGDHLGLPKRLVQLITDYLETYTAPDGTPIFSGDSYFSASHPGTDDEIKPEQRGLDVVDSFSISVTLMLATIGFAKTFRSVVTREALRQQVDRLEEMASIRLTAAMVGLLRSFAVNVFDTTDEEGRLLLRSANQGGLPERQVVEELRRSLREINARLRDDVTIGSGAEEGSRLDNPHRLFECGWSWGLVENAPLVQVSDPVGQQHEGVAEPKPYLYFTVVALEAIRSLFSERTRLLGLLNDEQLRLAQALQLRWDLTQSYWSVVGTFGSDRWPLEDMPWRATDGVQSDYFTLLISGMVVQDLVTRRASDADLARVGAVLDELANRSRITRRPFGDDPAVHLHHPGVAFALVGSEKGGGPQLGWVASDFAPVLLKRTVQLAGLLSDNEARQNATSLAGRVWTHLTERRLTDDRAANLWDDPSRVLGIDVTHTLPSWYYTKRVVDCLIQAAQVIRSSPPRSERLTGIAADLLIEAEHLYDQEQLNGLAQRGERLRTELEQVNRQLQRARRILRQRPGSAKALAEDVLIRLDRLAAAREATAEPV